MAQTALIVAHTDNRDPHSTILTMGGPGGAPDVYKVDVDPFELFHNMLENNYKNPDADMSDLEDMLDTIKNFMMSRTIKDMI